MLSLGTLIFIVALIIILFSIISYCCRSRRNQGAVLSGPIRTVIVPGTGNATNSVSVNYPTNQSAPYPVQQGCPYPAAPATQAPYPNAYAPYPDVYPAQNPPSYSEAMSAEYNKQSAFNPTHTQ